MLLLTVTTSKAQQQKAVYASVSGVPTPQLVVSGVSSAVKMSPQIPAHMLNQLVAQQKQQRSRIAKV
ncbi:unnamed protein product [Clavelina lepadiformis]|uniref:Uncharacterized protein n=1 Tax=Clavelina lepadiformis TaxID=159417 RepID=A0ABP0FLJ4_CLALP